MSVKALMEEPEKVSKESVQETIEEEEKPVPTAMEIAIREAMERSKKENPSAGKAKKGQSANNEMEDIYSRTLEKKVKTAAD